MKRVALLTLILITFMSCTAFAARWEWVTSTDTTGFYIDASNVNLSKKYNIMTFWVKTVYEDENERLRQIAIAERVTPNIDFSNFYYSNSKLEMTLINNDLHYRSIVSYMYGFSNELIHTENRFSRNWEPVPPDSIMESCFKAAFKYVNIH